MMSILILAAAAAPPRTAVLSADEAKKMAPLCRSFSPELVGDASKLPVGAQKLNQLPNANAYQAVVRLDENGCSRPTIIAYDVGAAPQKQR